ncbi:MAG TPA: glycerol-3-phosphate dehydrogenase/oxidase [Bryobacteraceae bacterium]|nr:glycerol-3-phosphate dehydrogenase/oxidase [Bryobacteraceae bacterium]
MPNLRQTQIEALQAAPLDALIIGGGINGAGILRDFALRAASAAVPLRLGLVEQGHFSSGTSGRNSQLIHGGLRYLKNLEFGLVREALRERALLVKLAPSYVRPLQFLMPFYSRFARFYYGAGLTLYDLLAGSRSLGRHSVLSRPKALATEPGLAPEGLAAAALFWDAQVHAARLVLANLFDALAHGALAANYVRAQSWSREADHWRVTLADTLSGGTFEVRARKLIDTSGPWTGAAPLRLVRGSHLILPRLTAGDHAIAWFEEAGRIIFVIPWGEDGGLSLVGTTDVDHNGSPDDVRISPEEVSYLMGIVRRIFPAAGSVRPLAAYSALRPLLREDTKSATRTSREHRIWNSSDGILHVAGGKYTTYRLMSEQAADLAARDLAPALEARHVTAGAPFPPDPLPRSMEERICFAVEHEMAQRLSDVMFVSTYRGYEQQWTRGELEPYARSMGALLGWDEARIGEEIESVLCQIAVPGQS